MSFANMHLGLPKNLGIVTDVDIDVTPALAQAVIQARAQLDMTHEDIARDGGPSGPTMTKIENARGTISSSTLKKLERALGWPRGEARRRAAGHPATAAAATPATDAALLGALMTANGWNELDVAGLLHVGTSTVHAWRAGEDMPARHSAILRGLYEVAAPAVSVERDVV